MHQHHVDGHSMQPGREGRIAAKGADFAMQLQKCLLSQIFRFCNIAQHSQAERIHSALVHVIENLKRRSIALLRQRDRRQFASDRRVATLLVLYRSSFRR